MERGEEQTKSDMHDMVHVTSWAEKAFFQRRDEEVYLTIYFHKSLVTNKR